MNEQPAVVADDEILAYYRARHGDPYMPLSMAMKIHRLARKYAHLVVERQRRQHGKALRKPVGGRP